MQIIILYGDSIRLPPELKNSDCRVFQSTTLSRTEISNIIHCCINGIQAAQINKELLTCCEMFLESFDKSDIAHHDELGCMSSDCGLCQLRNVISKAKEA